MRTDSLVVSGWSSEGELVQQLYWLWKAEIKVDQSLASGLEYIKLTH